MSLIAAPLITLVIRLYYIIQLTGFLALKSYVTPLNDEKIARLGDCSLFLSFLASFWLLAHLYHQTQGSHLNMIRFQLMLSRQSDPFPSLLILADFLGKTKIQSGTGRLLKYDLVSNLYCLWMVIATILNIFLISFP